ncbi:MAG: hypothetical protein JSW62_05860 [Thermoplasmatales archaeon]|nr:MAG: hypothetical protein JSW62_05860 [Thermoplasmatales archaeon]
MWTDFLLSMLMLVFGIASILAGIFTAYFGSGKSRAVGFVLIIIGLIVFIIFLWFAGLLGFMGDAPISWAGKGIIVNGIVAVIGAIIGALIALGIFLMAIMKA